MSDDDKTLKGVPEPDPNTLPGANNPIRPLRRTTDREGEGGERSNNPIPPKPKPAPPADEK